jgi:molybdate transport system regulatory protein
VRLAYRLWLESNGRAFGEGPAALLDLVRTEGSLSKAAAALGMSYNKAWRSLRAAEERLGFALLERQVGGKAGGGSRLSPQGEELLKRYQDLRADVDRELERLFRVHFSDWPGAKAAPHSPQAPPHSPPGVGPSSE